jgi:hypothetical protein
MEIINKSTYHLTVQASGTESIDTEIRVVTGYPPSKFLVSYFEGTGTLEVSQNGNVWVNTNVSASTLISNEVTFPRYCRISNSGEKLIHLVKYV